MLFALLLGVAQLAARPPVEAPADGLARPELRSPPYYAVILRSAPPCSLGATELASAQADFPAREVFSTDFECAPEANETFTGVRSGLDFIAAYAGRERREATRVLNDVRRRVPDAYLRRMRTLVVAP